MFDKRTDDLLNTLKENDPRRADKWIETYESELMTCNNPFAAYMRKMFHEHKIRQQDVFLKADFSQRYGYRLISGEKRTRQRDYILRICLAAEFTLQETQRALQIYGMSGLYARIPRDAVLIMAIENGIYDIARINELLDKQHMPSLKASTIEE